MVAETQEEVIPNNQENIIVIGKDVSSAAAAVKTTISKKKQDPELSVMQLYMHLKVMNLFCSNFLFG